VSDSDSGSCAAAGATSVRGEAGRGTPELELEEIRVGAPAEAKPVSVERDLEFEGALQLLSRDPLAV